MSYPIENRYQMIFNRAMLASITAGAFIIGTLISIGADTVEPTYKCDRDVPIAVCNWAHSNANAIVKTVGAVSLGFGLLSVFFAYSLLQTLPLDDEPS